MAVALFLIVSYVKPAKMISMLRAESREISKGNKTATYQITVKDSDGLVAICQALAYRKQDPLSLLP